MVRDYLKSNMETLLKEDAGNQQMLSEAGIVTNVFYMMKLPLICNAILSLHTYGEDSKSKSETLTITSIDAVKNILKEAKQASKIPLTSNVLKEKYTLIEDSLIVLSQEEIGIIEKCNESVKDECRRQTFKCKQLRVKYMFQLKNIEILKTLLQEGADFVDIKILTDIRDELVLRKNNKESNTNDLLGKYISVFGSNKMLVWGHYMIDLM